MYTQIPTESRLFFFLIYIIVLATGTSAKSAGADTARIDWFRTYGEDQAEHFDEGYCVKVAPDGKLVFVSGWQTICASPAGDTLWTCTVSNHGWIDLSIRGTAADWWIDVEGFVLSDSICIGRISSSGTLLRCATMAISETMYMRNGAIRRTNDGGYAVLSAAEWPPHSTVIRLDSAGREIWKKTCGGIFGYDLYVDKAGNCVVGGTGGQAVLISAGGDSLWNYHANMGRILSVTPAGDGGCMLGGETTPVIGENPHIAVTRIGPNGALVWNKSYSNGAHIVESCDCIEADDKGFFVGGYSGGSAIIFRIDPLGEKKWQCLFNDGAGANRVNDICRLADGSVVMTGQFYDSNQTLHHSHAFLAKVTEEVSSRSVVPVTRGNPVSARSGGIRVLLMRTGVALTDKGRIFNLRGQEVPAGPAFLRSIIFNNR